jgi:flagellar biogenesis protein FliO
MSKPESQSDSLPATSARTVTTQAGEPLVFKKDAGPDFFGALLPLVVLLACVTAGLWLLKRLKVKADRTGASSTPKLKVLQTVHLSPKARVAHIACGEQEFLLSYSDSAQAWIAVSASKPGDCQQ